MSETVAAGTIIEVRVPATAANLGPGFDSFALALGLYNTLELTVLRPGSGTSIDITGEGEHTLARDDENLVVTAMERLAAISGRPLPSFHLRMRNGIPLGRGLGSSAAAIAGGLLGAAVMLGVDHSPTALLDVALSLEGHPDNIVAALWGGFTIGALQDGGAAVHRIAPPEGLHAVMLIPDQYSSTNESRATLPESVTRADSIFNTSRAALMVAAFAEGKLDLLRVAMEDRLHQPYRTAGFRYLPTAIDAAIAAGAHGASLSGAGSSVIALASTGCDRIAAAFSRVASEYRLNACTCTLSPDSAGATFTIR
jgi:homoserine kinase